MNIFLKKYYIPKKQLIGVQKWEKSYALNFRFRILNKQLSFIQIVSDSQAK